MMVVFDPKTMHAVCVTDEVALGSFSSEKFVFRCKYPLNIYVTKTGVVKFNNIRISLKRNFSKHNTYKSQTKKPTQMCNILSKFENVKIYFCCIH